MNKKGQELNQLEQFLPQLFVDSTYTIEQPGPPLPDAIISANKVKIGIELTEYIFDSEIRRREIQQDLIIKEAQNLFETENSKPLHVDVSFKEEANWMRVSRREAAEYLANVISKQVSVVQDLPQYNTQFDLRIDNINHSYIEEIGVLYSEKYTSSSWYPADTFVVPTSSSESIQKIISGKNKKVAGYLSGCSEVWLLILETGNPSSYFNEYDSVRETIFESAFHRTLIGRLSKGDIIELKTVSI